MFRLLADADVHGDLLRGIQRRLPLLDLVRVQDVLPEGVDDRQVLEYALAENRVLITNDRNTMIGFACDLAARNTRFPGVIVTQLRQSIGSAIDDLESILSTMSDDALRGHVILYLPYRGIGLSG